MHTFFYAILSMSLLLLSTCPLHAEFFFSNKESRINVNQNSQLKLYSSINNVNGTVNAADSASIEGSSIVFKNGIFEKKHQKAGLTGTLDTSGLASILLEGNDLLHADPGTIIEFIEISGSNNRIEGQPSFQNPLNFFDAATSVTLALQKKLNNSILLNGGKVFLDDDLHLADQVTLYGPGIIEGNQTGLEVTSDEGTLTSSLMFLNLDALELKSNAFLSGIWTLSGSIHLNGHGTVLTIENGGKIIIANDSLVEISDIKIRGINTNSFLFGNNNSKVKLSNVNLELDNHFSTSVGGMYVANDVTFLLQDYNFLLDQNASITFDGMRTIIDHLDTAESGQLQLPLPLFDNHTLMDANINANIAAGTMTIFASSTFSEAAFGGGNIFITNNYYGGGGLTPTTSYIISTVITVSHVGLDDTFWVPVKENVIAGTDVVIDASGNAMFFAHGTEPQVIINPGYSLTLKNIEFGRINENTFNIHPTGKLYIAENVQMEFNQNITFSQGRVTFTGNDNVVNFRGMGGNKVVNITGGTNNNPAYFDIGSNTLKLQDVELNGVENIKFSEEFVNGQVIRGAIALAGGARVNIDRSTDATFIIEGTDNVIRILKNNITLNGALLFGDAVSNEIHIDFVLTSGINTENTVQFGDNFAYLYSDKGKAGLFFDDYLVNVINKGSNSFIMDAGSFLEGNDLFVGNYPIKQLSFDIGLSRGLLLSSDQVNAIDPSFARSILSNVARANRPMTAYHLEKNRPKKQILRDPSDDVESELLPEAMTFRKALTRALTTPTPVTMPIGVGASVQLANAFGTISMEQGSSIFNFGVNPGQPLNLIMSENCTLEQGTGATTLKPTDNIYVLGRNNVLRVTNLFEILGNIFLDDNAELIIECSDLNNSASPLVLHGNDFYPAHMTIPQGGRLIVRGNGAYLLAPESIIESGALNNQTPAELLLHDRITVGMQETGTAHMRGNIVIELNHLAELLVGPNQHIIIGTENKSAIKATSILLVDHQSRIRLDGSDNESFALARLSIAGQNSEINFERGSELYIDQGGIFELNSINENKALSNLKTFAFGLHTLLYMHRDGMLILGDNNFKNPKNNPITWNLKKAKIDCSGLFKRAGKNIYGVPQALNVLITGSAEEIMYAYINRGVLLIKAIYFLDIDGNYYLRTRDGVIVPLEADEDDLSENATSGAVTGIERGNKFTIHPQGYRI